MLLKPHSMDNRLFQRLAVTACAVIAAQIVLLFLMGRIIWPETGFGFITRDAWSSLTSQLLLDPYTTSHFLHGIIFYAVLRAAFPRLRLEYVFAYSLLLELAWELLENSPIIINRYRSATAALDYTGDSILNSVGDMLSVILGFWVAHRFPWQWVVILVIAIEFAMLIAIRDNLTLNVLMLLYPVAAIKAWQTGG